MATNIAFLDRLSSHKSFRDGDVHTGFIEVKGGPTSEPLCDYDIINSQQHEGDLFPPARGLSEEDQFLASLTILCLERYANAHSPSFSEGIITLYALMLTLYAFYLLVMLCYLFTGHINSLRL